MHKGIVLLTSFLLIGCANRYQNTALALATGSQSPMSEMEQTYYLGAYDPTGQLPPQIYRIRVRGQASLGTTQFASGWVPAQVMDTLSTTNGFAADSTGYGAASDATFLQGRKLVVFGPEGFREVPASHRLVMVMGNNPDDIFRAASEALGQISQAEVVMEQRTLDSRLFRELSALLKEKQRLTDLRSDLAEDAQ